MHNESKSENNKRRTIYNCLAKKTDDYEKRRKIVCHDVDKSNDGIYLFKFLPDFITIVFSLQMFRL